MSTFVNKISVSLVVILVCVLFSACNKPENGPDKPGQQVPPNEQNQQDQTPSPVSTELITVSAPLPNQEIKSPFTVEGEARGPWFWEASFPVKVIDKNNKVVAETLGWAQGEWMTNEFVGFKAELSFAISEKTEATLVLEKSNASGLPENAQEIRIPVILLPNGTVTAPPQQTTVSLFYYDASKDKDEKGQVLCSEKGLVAVERKIPLSKTPIQDTVRLLLKGELTAEEKARSVTTEYPLAGFEFENAAMSEGVVTLKFKDPQMKTGGGSCRAAVLWKQIEATVKQFPGVTSVKFIPEELFQP